MLRGLLTVCFFVFMNTFSWGQKSLIEEGNTFFDRGRYAAADDIYNQVENVRDNAGILYKRGIALYHLGKFNRAVTDLTAAYTLGKKTDKIFFYTGAALHSLGKYVDAAEFYKDYLKYVKSDTEKAQIIERIKQCGYGADYKYVAQKTYVENIGSPVNTPKNEIRPIISPNQSNRYYFSSNREGSEGGLRDENGYVDEERGDYKYDIYTVFLNRGNWTEVQPLNTLLNTGKTEVIQGFSDNGKVLIYSKGFGEENARIYTDTLGNTDSLKLLSPFISPIEGENGDAHLQVYGTKYMFFSSDRPGGYGGYDIYCIEWQDSTWSQPKNLGPEINTIYNEVDPHLINDGTTLFFSSDKTQGFGGYDIFVSEYNADSRVWSAPENMGLPLNSPSNDRYFRLNKDGQSAVLSSDRDGTLGGYDIHIAYFKERMNKQKTTTARSLAFMIEPVIDTTVVDTMPVIEHNVVTISEVESKDIYYGNDENILTTENILVMDGLVNILNKYPNAQVMLSGNSLPEGLPEFDLYFSVKRAEKVADYLRMKGIDGKRIYVSGHGINYPRAKVNPNNMSMNAKKNNRRIDIFLYANGEPFTFKKDLPRIQDVYRDDQYDGFKKRISGLAYKVVFTTVKQMYKGDILQKYADVNLEKRSDENLYNYTVGIYTDYQSARRFKNQLLQNGYPEARVVPYLDGVPLSYQSIFLNADKYPDLKDYMMFEVGESTE